MNPVQAVRNALEKYEIIHGEPLVVGVSGWVDSMVLLHAMIGLHDPKRITAIHVNHWLRWPESDADEMLVRDYCGTHGISFAGERINISELASASKIGLEEAGRIARKEAYERARKETGARFVVLAHHLDDTVETILFNFFRGSKLRGLAWMDELNGNILRPFLSVTKSEIRSYASENRVPFREDASNASEEFLRNRIRKNIIPEIEAINPNFRENILAFAQYAKALHLANEAEISHFLDKNSFTENEFLELGEISQNCLIETLYRAAHGTSVGLSEGNIAELRKFVTTANGATKKELGKLLLMKKNRTISWSFSSENSR